MLPRTLRSIKIAVKRTPKRDRTTVIPTVWKVPDVKEALKEKSEILVAGLATITCALNKPIKAMNKPIPADTAFFKVIGMALKSASRIFVRDKMIKIIPSTKTADKAVSHEYPICNTTV